MPAVSPSLAPTLAVFEGQATILAEREGLTCTRSDIKRLAKQLRRDYLADMERWHPEAVSDTRILGITKDETPRDAFRKISQNDRAAARRLGLVSA